MDEAERCSHVGYIYMSKLIVCGEPDDLKQMPEVNPPDTRRLDVTCDHVTIALQSDARVARRAQRHGLRAIDAPVWWTRSISRDPRSNAKLRGVGIAQPEIHEIGPSLEDVFVSLREARRKIMRAQETERAARMEYENRIRSQRRCVHDETRTLPRPQRHSVQGIHHRPARSDDALSSCFFRRSSR